MFPGGVSLQRPAVAESSLRRVPVRGCAGEAGAVPGHAQGGHDAGPRAGRCDRSRWVMAGPCRGEQNSPEGRAHFTAPRELNVA